MAIILDIVFGAIGSGYLIYGKRQYDATFLITGFILCAYPYFVSNAWLCALIGIAVSAAPFVMQRLA